jgi:O-antigen ligase
VMAALAVILFAGFLFLRRNRLLLLDDRVLLLLLILFTANNVVSSLLSIEKGSSTLLSLLWFLVILIPVSLSRFGLKDREEFIGRWIEPAAICILLVIFLFMSARFGTMLLREGFIFKRIGFRFLGTSTTADMVVMLGAVGYGWFRKKEEPKYLWAGFIYLLLGGFSIFLTLDRGGMAAYFVVMVILLAHDYRRLIILMVMAGVLVYLATRLPKLYNIRYLFDYLYLRYRLLQILKGHQLASFRSAWFIIRDHWLLGVGTNNFNAFSKLYGRPWGYAHNFILQFWAENGLFGMVFGLSIIGLFIRRWIRTLRDSRLRFSLLGVGAGFVGILVGNLTNSTLWLLQVALPFWALAGIIGSVYGDAFGRNGASGAAERRS